MEKPISIVYEEFKEALANLINNYGLPAFVIEPVLRDYLSEVQMIKERQYKMEKNQYEESLKKETEKQDEEVA